MSDTRTQIDKANERLAHLNRMCEVIQSGYAGILSTGELCDRREHPDAIPIPENSLMKTPAPKPTQPHPERKEKV